MPDATDLMIQRYGAQRVCDELTPFLTLARLQGIERVLDSRLDSVTLLVEDTYDPHNAVAAVRTSEALGISTLHAIAGADHFRLAPGITRGCHRWMDIRRWQNPVDCVVALRQQGFAIYGTAPESEHDMETIAVDQPVAVMFGNEHAGLSAQAMQQCDVLPKATTCRYRWRWSLVA
jgi:tRNA (guanosine-2'-O-)-methyltransferase